METMIEQMEQMESIESIIKYSLTEIQKDAINDYVDFNNMDTISIIREYDADVKSFIPNLKTNVHLSLMDGYSEQWSNFLNEIEPYYIESISDKEQIKNIAQYMAGIEDIKFERWSELSCDQMIDVLNKMEKDIARIEHRPSATISAKDLGEKCFGQQQGYDITINTRFLEQSATDPQMHKEMLNTLIHEGRHMYQRYNIFERMVHESPSEVESWRENLCELKYQSGEPVEIKLIGHFFYTDDNLIAVGERLYYYQPVEIDAREFSGDVMKLYQEYLSENVDDGVNATSKNITFRGVNDKGWHLDKAKEYSDWADWHRKKANDALDRGDLSIAKDHFKRAEIAETKANNHLRSAEICSK